jgi:hypothetical protein
MISRELYPYKLYFKYRCSYHLYEPIWCRASYAYHTSTLTFLFEEIKKQEQNNIDINILKKVKTSHKINEL